MIKNYILHNEDGAVKQFIKCDEAEIEMYQSSYIEVEEDKFEFDSNYDYKIENSKVIKIERTDEAYLKSIGKSNRLVSVSNIEVEYKGVIYQGDETSQDRMSRAINGLPDNTTIIPWKAKDNSSQLLTRIDLKEILFLAGQEQTKIWFNN